MDYSEGPDTITIVKTIEHGVDIKTNFGRDSKGNIWVSDQMGDKQTKWQLYLRADQVQQQAPVTMESVLRG